MTLDVGSADSYRVTVRELCEFAAKRGDLDHRFTPSPTAQQGIAGHAIVASRRGEGRRNEVQVSGQFRELKVRGRADGYYPEQGLLEEVKTHRCELERMPANHRALHWAQAKVYAALLSAELELLELSVCLLYFDIASQRETALVQRCSAAELRSFFESLCMEFLSWGMQESAHRRLRDEALSKLQFPHQTYRPGQRRLAEDVFRAARHGRLLMAEAPTGIGKTLATIFPMLKACATEQFDKVFFLGAKGTGLRLALDAFASLQDRGLKLPLRVVELVSREKSCEHPDKACHGESCPLARGFYDRLPDARKEAVGGGLTLAREAVRAIAARHGVCPYYLTQELVRWADVVIADYNYMFDSTAALHLLTLANEWKVGLLVDEAHNLVERARSMYSGELSEAAMRRVRRGAPPAVSRPLARLSRAWSSITKARSTVYEVIDSVPDRFLASLSEFVSAVGELQAEAPDAVGADLLRFYLDAIQFQRLVETFGPHSMIDSTLEPGATARGAPTSRLCIRNVLPATFLRPRYATAAATVMFSATLTPQHFYADMLGLPRDTVWLEVAPPFDPSQLAVRVVTSVSTRFADRSNSLEPIASLMAGQYKQWPGNYLAFFSSFDYLERAAAVFGHCNPEVPIWLQARHPGECEREAFLRRFSAEGCGIGFAVLGGSFGEGIDLPGRRLIGAFITTLGLPQANPVNEAMRSRLEAVCGSGFDYAYLYPGLRKVVQAAGRVIRTDEDTGFVFLIDKRYKRRSVQALLPSWWACQSQ